MTAAAPHVTGEYRSPRMDADLETFRGQVRIARVFVDDCIRRQLDGTLDTATASMAKWWCTDLRQKVADDCLQLYGGYGYMTEYPISRMFADARVQRIYGGTNEIMKEVIARSL
jgi:acyl-CoA dehydrogenase